MKEILLLGMFWLLTDGLKESPCFPVYGEVSKRSGSPESVRIQIWAHEVQVVVPKQGIRLMPFHIPAYTYLSQKGVHLLGSLYSTYLIVPTFHYEIKFRLVFHDLQNQHKLFRADYEINYYIIYAILGPLSLLSYSKRILIKS